MPFSSYSFPSTEAITRTFNAYSFSGETKSDRFKGAIPTDLAERAWVYQAATSVGVAEGGGISIYGARQEITPEIAWEDV
jgi:hypothetical protein